MTATTIILAAIVLGIIFNVGGSREFLLGAARHIWLRIHYSALAGVLGFLIGLVWYRFTGQDRTNFW